MPPQYLQDHALQPRHVLSGGIAASVPQTVHSGVVIARLLRCGLPPLFNPLFEIAALPRHLAGRQSERLWEEPATTQSPNRRHRQADNAADEATGDDEGCRVVAMPSGLGLSRNGFGRFHMQGHSTRPVAGGIPILYKSFQETFVRDRLNLEVGS